MFEFESPLFVFNSSLKSKLGIPKSVILQEKKNTLSMLRIPPVPKKIFKGFTIYGQHTCDIPRSRRVFPILTPFTRRSSRRAKSPACSIFLSDFFADRPIFMSTVVYGIVYARRRPQLKIQKD